MKFNIGDILNYQDEIIIIKKVAFDHYLFTEFPEEAEEYQYRCLSTHALHRLAKLYVPQYNQIWNDLNENSI